MSREQPIPTVLGLRAGDEVEVRSEEEILSTLDAEGKLEGLPFMPEMLRYCGQRTQVHRRANKACDTVTKNMSRRMLNTVHLANVRCDGAFHSGCQASCLMFWKEAWLRRPETQSHWSALARRVPLTRARLHELASYEGPAPERETLYRCQATELPHVGRALRWWEPGQYLRELVTRNVNLGTFLKAMGISWFNAIQRWRGGLSYPHVEGLLTDNTPRQTLDLIPGERVRVRPLPEILATLDVRQRNRGLSFDVEMVPFCGHEYIVQRRVNTIIQEPTGKVMTWPGDCIVLEGVVCSGCLSRNRLFCMRSITAYWREIWLERVEEPAR